MSFKRKRDHLSCYPIPLFNIKIPRQLYYLLRVVQDIKELAFFVTRRIMTATGFEPRTT